MHDWFEALTGFAEDIGAGGDAATRDRLALDGTRLTSRVNGRSFAVGTLELASLRSLRERAQAGPPVPGPCRVDVVQGNARALHRRPDCAGALFQVASQFNLLEMTGPDVTPEDGV